MRSITPILNTKGLSSLNDCAKVKLLLYGDDSLSRDENSIKGNPAIFSRFRTFS